ncbi:MAG: DUF2764 family protein [Chitinivibrionales bacterium]
MARNYYYLVSGLPDLILDGTKKPLGLVEFVDEVSEQLHPDDAQLFRYIRYPIDNRNLVALLKKDTESFDERGNFSREELEQEIRSPDRMPQYMTVFMEAHNEGKELFPGLTQLDQLSWLFYDWVLGVNNEFVREWFSFERDLRNVVAGLNCRKMRDTGVEEDSCDLSTAIVTRNTAAQSILKSNAPDFSLSSQLPWIERVIAMSEVGLVDFEKSLDQLRWDELNEFTTFTGFRMETILAFSIKVEMVERWQQLDSDVGKEKVERLIKELKAGFQMSKEF